MEAVGNIRGRIKEKRKRIKDTYFISIILNPLSISQIKLQSFYRVE